MDPKHERKIAWIALFLTSGEFTVAIWMWVHDGHVFAIYLAVTYASREITKGVHYYDIVVEGVKKAWRKG